MRRSVPTKRAYQILLCVDDSKSMGESNSGNLALESLVMVSRSLTMLEAGQIGVVGFGADVFTAHDLAAPFSSHDAGARVLQRFSFSQDRTDICLLIRSTIDRFRAARLQANRGGEDLWQLALILSDGLTQSATHDSIRRLLREAAEERIMIVFIVMDDATKRKGDSVLQLKEARFVKDVDGTSRVVIERYLDTFPFQYYLIVHHLEDLPNALSGLLRTWFAEVNA
jgi:midasin